MHVLERMVFRVTKLVLQTRTSRNLFAAYLFGLHFMVFWMLWSYAGVHTTVASAASAADPIAAGSEEGTLWQKEGFDKAGT